MLATRFIIALCPASKVYLVKYDVPANRIFSPHAATVATETTRVKGEAALFETFEAAMELCADITGWGGAQRVEEVAVEVEDTRVTLDTPEARIEVRDAATSAWHDFSERFVDGDITTSYERSLEARIHFIGQSLRSLGIKVGSEVRAGASCTASLYLADHLGNLLDLDWDPMQYGFSYETEGDDACDIGETEAQYEAEPNTVCDGCGSDEAEDTDLLGVVATEAESLREQVRLNAQPEEMVDTLTDLLTDLRLACLTHGIDFAAALRRSETHAEAEAETATCDGCGSDDAEPCGDSEGFAFCAACRAKDANARRE